MAKKVVSSYSDDHIRTYSWEEHIRMRPGMYIGRLGDGSHPDDGIYVLLKEVLDNSIDEFMEGVGSKIELTIENGVVRVRDYGRGIPLGSVVAVVSKMNTGAKFSDEAFDQSIGMNGVGVKAVNALSKLFRVRSFRNGEVKEASFSCAKLIEDKEVFATEEETGTEVTFEPDETVFKAYSFQSEFIEKMIKNYVYLNVGLTIIFNGKKYTSKKGLIDLLEDNMSGEPLYKPISFKGDDIEVVLTHANQYGEEYYSFVNSQNTIHGGTHLTAFREVVARVIKDFYSKNFDYSDIRSGMVAAISIKIKSPIFESQTKTKLGSKEMYPDGPTILKFLGDFLSKELDNYLHIHSEDANTMLQKIQDNERERKSMSGIRKVARERAKKVSLHNSKLKECLYHLNDAKVEHPELTSIFITEGDSASGTITACRDVRYQAVFGLRGKPLNCFGKSKKVVYENEEFNYLQAALNIEDGIEGLRYNRIIIATDADDDGMHIRLLIMTFFLQFFPELVRNGHIYILETPLFSVYLPKELRKSENFMEKETATKTRKKSKKGSEAGKDEIKNIYCYSEAEKIAAMEKFGSKARVTRFKGLGEINESQFKDIIAEETIKLEQVRIKKEDSLKNLLSFYMGDNTSDRQNFIIDNLVVD